MVQIQPKPSIFPRKYPILKIFVLVLIFLFSFLLCASLGPQKEIRLWDLNLSKNYFSDKIDEKAVILFKIRIPRLILAILVGGSLALSGLIFQNLLQNPLADPYIIGISGGCGLAAVLAQLWGLYNSLEIALCAFGGGMGAMLFVERIAKIKGSLDRGILILGGVVLNAFFSALISIALISAGQDMPKIFYWLMGSLNLPDFRLIFPMALFSFFAAVILWIFSHPLDILSLGDFQAYHLGLETEKIKWICLCCASVLTAVSVSLSGMIGFIGMFVPHSVRLLCGNSHKFLIPFSFFGGAFVLMITDTIVRISPTGTEIPVGALTALMGGPFFLAILIRNFKTQ